MTTNEKTPTTENKKIVVVFIVLAVILAVLSSLTPIQKFLEPYLKSQSRSLLAKVTHFYGFDHTNFSILKFKDPSGIQIEIYEINPESSAQTFVQKFDLSQDSDAYVSIDKNSTNLALSDLDQDGHLDILAPSVDRNGNLRLNTFRFNPELKSFDIYTQP